MREVKLPVDEDCWRGVIVAALRRGKAEVALEALREMTAVDHIEKPSATGVYVPLLEFMAERDMTSEVISVLRDMELRSVVIDSKTWKKLEKMRRFHIVMDAFGKA